MENVVVDEPATPHGFENFVAGTSTVPLRLTKLFRAATCKDKIALMRANL